ncbi:MAG: sugar phosphate isomerase/epimerase family protein [Candidatus Flexifilum sp.]
MKIAIQEDMLSGRTVRERFEHARKLGVAGVEVWGRGLTARVPEIGEAAEATGIPVAAVNHGRQGRLLDPHPLERERALSELRQSISDAADLGAKGVIFVPHFFGPALPDLSPWKTAWELQAELLNEHLRGLEDYAAALDVELYVEPVNRYETSFLNRLEQAAQIAARRGHPNVKIVADLFHMALEEADSAAAIRQFGPLIGHVHLADHNRRLPGQGLIDFAALAAALHEVGYTGWAAYETGDPGENAARAEEYQRDLPASLEHLRAAGWF